MNCPEPIARLKICSFEFGDKQRYSVFCDYTAKFDFMTTARLYCAPWLREAKFDETDAD